VSLEEGIYNKELVWFFTSEITDTMNSSIFLIFYFCISIAALGEAFDEYIVKFTELNKNYRHSLSNEVTADKNYIVFTSFVPVTEEDNDAFEYKDVTINRNQIQKIKIFKELKLSVKQSAKILAALSISLKGKVIDIASDDVVTYKISIHNEHDVIIFESHLNCFNLMNIRYPISNHVDRLNTNFFIEATKLIPLNKEQLEYISKRLPKKHFDRIKNKLKRGHP